MALFTSTIRPFLCAETEIPVNAQLAPEIVNLEGSATAAVEVELRAQIRGESVVVQQRCDVTLHGRGALVWDDVGRAAAFITPADPTVEATRVSGASTVDPHGTPALADVAEDGTEPRGGQPGG